MLANSDGDVAATDDEDASWALGKVKGLVGVDRELGAFDGWSPWLAASGDPMCSA